MSGNRCESEFSTKTHDKCAPMLERRLFALKSPYMRVGWTQFLLAVLISQIFVVGTRHNSIHSIGQNQMASAEERSGKRSMEHLESDSRNTRKKQHLSRAMPVLGHNAIAVSYSAHQTHYFDFYDSLAHVARQRSMQEMHALRVQNDRLTEEVRGLMSKLEEQNQLRRRAVRGAKSAIDKIQKENLKLRKDNEAMRDLKRDFALLNEEKKQLESKSSLLQKKVEGMAAILRGD